MHDVCLSDRFTGTIIMGLMDSHATNSTPRGKPTKASKNPEMCKLQGRVSELQRELKTHVKEQGKRRRHVSEADIRSMIKEAVDQVEVANADRFTKESTDAKSRISNMESTLLSKSRDIVQSSISDMTNNMIAKSCESIHAEISKMRSDLESVIDSKLVDMKDRIMTVLEHKISLHRASVESAITSAENRLLDRLLSLRSDSKTTSSDTMTMGQISQLSNILNRPRQ